MLRETGVQSQVTSYQKLQKILFDASLFNIQQYKVQIKGKWSNLGKEVAPFLTPQCSTYWKASLRVAVDYGSQLIYIYIYIYSQTTIITLLWT